MIGLGVTWLASAGAAYCYGNTAGHDAEQAAAARDRQVAEIAGNKAAAAAAAAISWITVKHQTITQEVQRDVNEKPVLGTAAAATMLCGCSTPRFPAPTPAPIVHLLAANCPPRPPLTDDSFGEWRLKVHELASQYDTRRAAIGTMRSD